MVKYWVAILRGAEKMYLFICKDFAGVFWKKNTKCAYTWNV